MEYMKRPKVDFTGIVKSPEILKALDLYQDQLEWLYDLKLHLKSFPGDPDLYIKDARSIQRRIDMVRYHLKELREAYSNSELQYNPLNQDVYCLDDIMPRIK